MALRQILRRQLLSVSRRKSNVLSTLPPPLPPLRRLLSSSPAKVEEAKLPEVRQAPVPPARPINFDMASRVEGQESQVVMIDIEPGQVLRAEAGNLVYMTDGIEMDTNTGGGLKNMFTRVVTGQNLFVTDFMYKGDSKGTVALGTDMPSKIIRLSLEDYGGAVICQKGAFIAGSHTVTIETAVTKMMAGFFGGEGFILQRLGGEGDAFVKASGTLIRRELAPGEVLRVASGSIVAFSASVQYDIQTVPGFKNAVFGGQGVFITTLTGPGTVFLQGLPPDRMLAEIARRIPSRGGMGIPIMMGGGGGGEGGAAEDGAAEGGTAEAAGAGDEGSVVAASGAGGDAALGAAAAESAAQTAKDNSGAVAGAAGMTAAEAGGFGGGGSEDLFGDAVKTEDMVSENERAAAAAGGGDNVGEGEEVWTEEGFKDDASSGGDDLGGAAPDAGGGGGGGGLFSSLWDFVTGNDDDD